MKEQTSNTLLALGFMVLIFGLAFIVYKAEESKNLPAPVEHNPPSLSAIQQRLDTVISNQHLLNMAITNHDHYVREWTRPVEF